MKLRINVGVEWGKILSGKKRVHKGYRPMRRVIQVKLSLNLRGNGCGFEMDQFISGSKWTQKFILLTSNIFF